MRRQIGWLLLLLPTSAWAVGPGQTLGRHPGPVRSLAYSPDGRLLATGGEDGVALWYPERGRAHGRIQGLGETVTALTFSADGSSLWVGTEKGQVLRYDPIGLRLQDRLSSHQREVSGLAVSKRGDRAASVSKDGTLHWYGYSSVLEGSWQSAHPLLGVQLHPDQPLAIVLGASNRYLAAGPPALVGFDFEKRTVTRGFPGLPRGGAVMACGPDGGLVAAGGADQTVGVWHSVNTDVFVTYRGHASPVTALAFRADGKLLASAAQDGLLFWELDYDALRDRASAPGVTLNALAFAPQGDQLVAAGSDGAVLLYDVTGLRTPYEAPPAQKKLREGTQLLAEQKTEAALAALRESVRLDNSSADAHFHLGRAHLEFKQIQEAINETRAALSHDPGHNYANFLMGAIAKENGAPDDAIKHLSAVVLRNPSEILAHQLLADVYKARGQHLLALQHARMALDILPANPDNAYNLACMYAVAQKPTEALDWLERALSLGYSNLDHLRQDADLASLRTVPRYTQLLARAGGVGGGGDSDPLGDQADALRKANHCDQAASKYEQAIQAERGSANPRGQVLRKWLFWSAFCHSNNNQDAQALANFEAALKLARSLGLQDDLTKFNLTLLGKEYLQVERYREAEEVFQEGLRLHRRDGEKDLTATTLRRLGDVYTAWGRYDEAKKMLDEALGLADQKSPERAKILVELSQVHDAWGQGARATEFAAEALRLTLAGTDAELKISHSHHLAGLHEKQGRFAEALALNQSALALAEQAGEPRRIALASNYLAKLYAGAGNKTEALRFSDKAVKAAQSSGAAGSIMTALIAAAYVAKQVGDPARAANLADQGVAVARQMKDETRIASALSIGADMHQAQKDYAKALGYLDEALAIRRRRGELPQVANINKQRGEVFYLMDRIGEANAPLSEAVRILEDLRKTAQGEARRAFTARVISTYDLLLFVQLKSDRTFEAYRTLELSRAKGLAETLAQSEAEVTVPTIPELQELAGDGAILMYATSNFGAFAAFGIDGRGITPRVRNWDSLVATIKKAATQELLAVAPSGVRGLKKKVDFAKQEAPDPLAEAVHLYRAVLQDPRRTREAKAMGRAFWDALIVPLEDRLADKKNLIVVPDGVLALLPFETLVSPQGQYLVERYDIRYTHSLSVLRLINARRHPANRQGLLALGGARYEDRSEPAFSAESAQKQLGRALAANESLRPYYTALGYGGWEPLPGTKTEVEGLARTIPGAKLVTGGEVSEANLRAWSQSGELAQYRTVHFATHGVVVPEHPELAALVLSQVPGPDDGYLRASEIVRLKFAADFVNLSACETGLGKIYGGEGVVGLAQAFLGAGANGLSMSLWQVADDSTAQFMTAMYTLEREGRSPAAASSEVKRRFLAGKMGERNKAPYYWAPFVHYGR